MTLQEARQMKQLTLQDLRDLDADMLPPIIVAKFLHESPYALNLRAKQRPDLVPFPFKIHGKNLTRVSFPRQGLIAWAEGKNLDL